MHDAERQVSKVAAWGLRYCLDFRRIPKFQAPHAFSNGDLQATAEAQAVRKASRRDARARSQGLLLC